MSSKLDKSLEEIAGSRRQAPGRRPGAKKQAAAPTGGVQKKSAARPTRQAPAVQKIVPTNNRGDSKIIVSNLPDDVTEQQIKEYFTSTVGPVRRVIMTYNKTGRSTGTATIVFVHSNSAAEAAKAYDGVKVDNRPMRIEVVMGAELIAPPAPAKGLSDRISTPKNASAKPKPAGAKENGVSVGKKGKAPRKAKAPRPKKKTAEELDADMADYFEPGAAANGATNGTAAAAPVAATNGGEAIMEDEVM